MGRDLTQRGPWLTGLSAALALQLLTGAAAQPQGMQSSQSGSGGQGTAAVTPVSIIEALPAGCNCTDLGISGNVDVDGRAGCGQHLLALNNDPTWFCYVVDPGTCPQALASTQFPGAYYRGCNPAVDTPADVLAVENRTLADIVDSVPDLSVFSSAIATTTLGDLLSDPNAGPFTVFAPSDGAFQGMVEAIGLNSTADLLDSPLLLAVLLLHIGQGAYDKTFLAQSSYQDITTLSPSAFPTVRASEERRVLYTAGQSMPSAVRVVVLNAPVYDPTSPTGTSIGTVGYNSFSAANGVLNVMDAVLAPPAEVVSTAETVPEFSTFVDLLNATGLADQLSADCPNATTANCDFNPITVFAPTNEAWQAFAASQNTTVSALADLLALVDILMYHVSDPSQVVFPILLSDLIAGAVIPNLYGSNISITTNTTLIPVGLDINLGTITYAQEQQLVLADDEGDIAGFSSPQTVEAYNGVLHAIDTVLLPYNISGLIGPAVAPATEAVPTVEPSPAVEPNLY